MHYVAARGASWIPESRTVEPRSHDGQGVGGRMKGDISARGLRGQVLLDSILLSIAQRDLRRDG